MNEAVFNLLMTVITAVTTALTAYVISFVKKKGEQAAAQTDSIKQKDAIEEITDAVTIAVSATSQTYVDSLKAAGSFNGDAQKQALLMSLTACIQALSPAAKTFIETAYGDLTQYLTGRIEAEVRKQKALPSTTTQTDNAQSDATSVAASTAAATAAAVVQNAMTQTTDK